MLNSRAFIQGLTSLIGQQM